jgi:predicted amidohydrolase YtcJ
MQKIGARRSINQYDPWRGLATAITRRARGMEAPLHPEEALTRAEALRFYTINNAKLLFLEDRTGSLEPGKLADFAVLDRDLLTCPEDDIVKTKVLQTFVGGKEIYTAK